MYCHSCRPANNANSWKLVCFLTPTGKTNNRNLKTFIICDTAILVKDLFHMLTRSDTNTDLHVPDTRVKCIMKTISLRYQKSYDDHYILRQINVHVLRPSPVSCLGEGEWNPFSFDPDIVQRRVNATHLAFEADKDIIIWRTLPNKDSFIMLAVKRQTSNMCLHV